VQSLLIDTLFLRKEKKAYRSYFLALQLHGSLGITFIAIIVLQAAATKF
jgi:hypothetical protein